MLTFERLPQETAREHALRTIKENIIRLELPPGSRIGEIELADKLGLNPDADPGSADGIVQGQNCGYPASEKGRCGIH